MNIDKNNNAYITLLTIDNLYLPACLVLSESLHKYGTIYKLIIIEIKFLSLNN